MTKNNINITPSNNDEEILDSLSNESNLNTNLNTNFNLNINPTLENSQEELTPTNPATTDITIEKEDVVSLDNNTSPTLITETQSNNITSTKKYKVIISTPTKYILNIDGNGASYTHNKYTLLQNYISGVTEIEEPIPEEDN